MSTFWQVSIVFDEENGSRPLSNGFFARNPEDVKAFGSLINTPVSKNDISSGRMLRIELSEDDPRLSLLLERIENTYGWKPSIWFNIPQDKRSQYFGVRKNRQYSRKDFDDATFLSLFANKAIATHTDGTSEQVERETCVAAADRLQFSKTQFGALFPFQGFCVTESLGCQLKTAGVRGLSLEPVVILPEHKMQKALFRISSSIIAPRSLLPVVNGQGFEVEPNSEWACYLDDGGYHPHEFKYRNADMEKFRDVDVVLSYERTGVTKARAYRWCIVSQRFRQIMADLKIPGVRYAPVRFVS